MRLLLDTHIFIWYISANPRLTPRVRALIEDENNVNLLSIASIWKMAIKQNKGKLSLSSDFKIFIVQQLSLNRISRLDITLDHIDVVARLPLHHGDPFDRLIIAQAIEEGIPILSADSVFDAYPCDRFW